MNKIIKETIENKLDELFIEIRGNRERRTGIHASSIIQTKGTFCIREQVLQYLFNNETQKYLPARVVRRMKNGDYIHKKWQDLFNETKIANYTEDQFISTRWNFTGTPDAIINLMNKKWIVEIKSIKSEQFEKMTKVPIGVERQAQIYMYMTAIPRAIVLYEDTNTSEFKPWFINYKYDLVKKYIKRLYKIDTLIRVYKVSRKLPRRKDKCTENDHRQCDMSKVCFGNRKYRRRMLKDGVIKV